MADAPHFAALGKVAIHAAKLEHVALAIFGLLIDRDRGTPGLIIAAAMANAQILDRTTILAVDRLENPKVVIDWSKQARAAMEDRNRLLHSDWRVEYDHATEEESLVRQRLARAGYFETDREQSVEKIEAVATTLMVAVAAGNSAYIVTERMPRDHRLRDAARGSSTD